MAKENICSTFAQAANAPASATVRPPVPPHTFFHISQYVSGFPLPPGRIAPDDLDTAAPHMNNPDGKPIVWAYIGGDDPTRGDSHGTAGLARAVQDLMGGRMVHVSADMLHEHFPNTDNYREKIAQLMARDGYPDIILGTSGLQAWNAAPDDKKPTVIIPEVNESGALTSYKTKGLVAHHLTPEELAEDGRAFRAQYPHLTGKLFGVMSVTDEYDDIRVCERNMKTLAELCAHEPQSSVFFCPSWRTDTEAYKRTVWHLQNNLKELGIRDTVQIMAPDFESIRHDFNPYRGLIDQADHLLVLGTSFSIMSEALTQGRPVYADAPYKRFEFKDNDKYVLMLDDVDTTRPLPQVRLPPLNVTVDVAERIADEFGRLSRLRTLGQQAQPDYTPPEPAARFSADAIEYVHVPSAPGRRR